MRWMITLCLLLALARPAAARTEDRPAGLEGIGLDQNLNATVPLDLVFRDEHGRDVKLGDYFVTGRPVILSLAYYKCPMLCTMVLNGLTRALNQIDLEPGKDFELVTVSFNALENPGLAYAKKASYLGAYNRKSAADHWHFLTGKPDAIVALTSAVGFRYRWDNDTRQFAHPSGIEIVTPDGRLARYFYGVDYSPKDLRLGLVESSQGKVGSPVDQILLFCYHYDPARGKYGFVIWGVIRVLSFAVLAALSIFLIQMFVRERRSRLAAGEEA